MGMPFYRLMGRCLPDELINFMAQYEATRTLSETLLESVPQLGVQVYMVVWCRNNTCNFKEDGDGELIQAFTVSIVSIIYRVVASWIEMKAYNLSLCGYIERLVKMGDGMPIASIKNNVAKEVKIEFKLSLAQVRLLSQALEHNTSINLLLINYAEIDDAKMQLLAPALGTMKSLKELVLYDNNIGAEGAKELAEVLKVNTSLKKINLRYNDIGAEGAKYVAGALKANTLLGKIWLSDNKIGAEGAKELAEALKVNTSLERIDLSNNEIADEGRQLLRDVWREGGKPI